MVIHQFLNFQSKSVRFSAMLLAASSGISAFLGLLRNRLLGSHFGAGGETDIYLAAFRIPDFIYGIVIMGGISVAFLPLFSEYVSKKKEELWQFVNNLLHVLLVVLGAACLLLALFAPLLMKLIAPGFDAEQQEEAVALSRLLFLSPVLFGISSMVSGVLHYFNRFVSYALAPIVYNLGIIAGILFLAPSMGVFGVGIGVVAGAALYLLIQLPSFVLSGFRWMPIFKPQEPSVARLFKLALPRIPGAMGYQLNLIVMTSLASLLPAGTITMFTFANDLQSFPVNLIGVPFAIAAFPALSRAFAQKQAKEMSIAFNAAARHVILLVLPLAALLFLFSEQAINLAYKMGNFGQADAQVTSALLSLFALGIVFQAIIPLQARAFFAMHDTKTPTAIGLVSVALNIFLALFFIFYWVPLFSLQIMGLPLALVISGCFQAVMLWLFLRKKLRRLNA